MEVQIFSKMCNNRGFLLYRNPISTSFVQWPRFVNNWGCNIRGLTVILKISNPIFFYAICGFWPFWEFSINWKALLLNVLWSPFIVYTAFLFGNHLSFLCMFCRIHLYCGEDTKMHFCNHSQKAKDKKSLKEKIFLLRNVLNRFCRFWNNTYWIGNFLNYSQTSIFATIHKKLKTKKV